MQVKELLVPVEQLDSKGHHHTVLHQEAKMGLGHLFLVEQVYSKFLQQVELEYLVSQLPKLLELLKQVPMLLQVKVIMQAVQEQEH